MPKQDVVDHFVATVVGGDYVGAIERFYAPDASIQENQDVPRVGRDLLIRHEQGIVGAFKSITCEVVGQPVITDNHVAIHWRFAFTPDGGQTRTLQEIAWQRWKDDKIAAETFFYDPRQLGG